MNANTEKVQSVIENKITAAIKDMTAKNPGCLISDLYLQTDKESGELQLYDEEEKLVCKVVIFDWVNSQEEEPEFTQKVSSVIKNALASLVSKHVFENPCFNKPFSISLTDEGFNVMEELLFLDDETFRLDDPLLKDLDAELDDFLDHLLSDMD